MTEQTLHTAQPRAPRRPLRWGMVLGGLAVIVAVSVARYYWGVSPASADPPRPAAAPATPAAKPTQAKAAAPQPGSAAAPAAPSTTPLKIVATVNTEQITREELARECLRHYGQQVLERLINKHLIVQECKRRNINITAAEVNQEIERIAGRFQLPTDQWLKMLQQERGITANQYASDIIWPTLALRKLAGSRLQVTADEIQKEYEKIYGEAVKARLIICDERAKAEKVRAEAAAHPDQFGNLAKEYSVDASASLKGLIQPIHRHVGDPQIEKAAFSMKNGEVSPVIMVGNQCWILLREDLLPPRNIQLTDQLRGSLEEIIRDQKMQGVANEVFETLQKNARVENVFNDKAKSAQMPGVAAVINGQQITLRELAELCIDRHGKEVLQGMVNRRLLEQACKKANTTVTEADLDAEIARAARTMLPAKPDGSPDVDGWVKLVTEEQGVSLEIYRHDAVWPSVALEKLVGDKIEVTQEDLQKGFEANYGPRVRCRAIVLDNLRQAQQVWEKARQNPTEDNFGDLAEQYSIDPSSRTLRGEFRPIQRHGGMAVLEKEAFELKPGELSSVIQVDSRYVILYCLGQTRPVNVDPNEVRELIRQDVHEKKQRIAMAEYFDKLLESATIDNYLEGSSRSPKNVARAPQARPSGSVVR